MHHITGYRPDGKGKGTVHRISQVVERSMGMLQSERECEDDKDDKGKVGHEKSVDGIQFVLPTDSYPYRVLHAYTSSSSPGAARCWVPCIDNLWEKCTWEFKFVVPRYLEEPDPGHCGEKGDFEESQESISTVVICSGDLVEQACHPHISLWAG
ncbi:uncharacterized protein EDB93DRAFT_1273391 [Suillus bovinus]|uniref:uncharacterized protein n=1 Tax=Suillus bovinus TaxID=48563 RepID=UPI001B8668D9|nr:uncharacterized protein EDB93DRAFT_1273391 [Suillus bovinus]KAG2152645.1 hypothetical protein EDB93DRAFT_1273391 [Suillus bovinus]